MSKRILVVEDQPDNRQIIRDMLAGTDYEITEAEDGEQALAAVAPRAWFCRRLGCDFLPLLARDRQQHFGLTHDALAFLLCRSRGTLLLGDAATQSIHQIDDVGTRGLFRPFNPLAPLLLAQKLLQRVFVLVLKFLRFKSSLLAIDDVDCQVEHVFGDFFVFDHVEIVFCLANLVGIAERDAHHPFVARFERDDVFTSGEYPRKRGIDRPHQSRGLVHRVW
jgi:CheY-like chemotaxis protein